jgi:hypothetical protein
MGKGKRKKESCFLLRLFWSNSETLFCNFSPPNFSSGSLRIQERNCVLLQYFSLLVWEVYTLFKSDAWLELSWFVSFQFVTSKLGEFTGSKLSKLGAIGTKHTHTCSLSLSLSLFLLLSLICKNQNGLNGSQHGFARKESVQKLSTLRWGTRFIRWVRLALREMIAAPQSVRDCPKYIIIVHTWHYKAPPPPL